VQWAIFGKFLEMERMDFNLEHHEVWRWIVNVLEHTSRTLTCTFSAEHATCIALSSDHVSSLESADMRSERKSSRIGGVD